MDRFIAVIDYGLGNLRTVSNALEAVDAKAKVTNNSKDVIAGLSFIIVLCQLNKGMITQIKDYLPVGRQGLHREL